MNADSNTWVSRRQAIVWCAAVLVIVLLATGYYFGRGSAKQEWKAEDSALIEETRLDIAADTNIVRRELPEAKFKMKKVKMPKEKSGPVSRNFLDEEVERP